MTDREASKSLRQETASRYAAWVSAQIEERDWTPATLARQSGLLKQQISDILGGKSSQPTAAQISALGRAFNVEPTEIFRELGFWELPTSAGSAQIVGVYRSLDFIQRRTLVDIGHRLRETQGEYAALLRPRRRIAETPALQEEPETDERTAALPDQMPSPPTWPPEEPTPEDEE